MGSKRNSSNGQRQAGFSLVELMLALALGLVVVTGIVQLFVGNSQTYNVLNGQARMQENARFALEFISRAARSAGYFGCTHRPQFTAKGLAGNWDLIPEFDITRAVQGYESGDPVDGMPRTIGGTDTNVYQPGTGIDTSTIEPDTDILVVRNMETPGWRLQEPLLPGGNPVISNTTEIEAGHIVMVANCEQAVMFQVTGVPASGANRVALEHVGAGGGPVAFRNAATITRPEGGDMAFSMSLISRTYQEDAVVGRVLSTYFFIAPGTGLDNNGDPPLALFQKVGTNAPVELVQGVEDLEVLYGIDSTLDDGIANANQYVSYGAVDVDNPGEVVSLRVQVTVNSVDEVTEDGQVLKRTFGKTILLRNANPEAV